MATLVHPAVEDELAREIPVGAPGDSAGEVRRGLAGRQFDSAALLAVCDDDRRLRGTVPIEDLLAAPDDASLQSLMDPDPPARYPGTDREAVAWKAVQHRVSAVAVVDDEGRLEGVMPPRALLRILLLEHEEDLTRLSGFLRDTETARLTSSEPLSRRYLHRLPWLILGLAGAMLSAVIVGRFEAQLQATLALAFFLPAIVYIADAVGTQTETIVVRGLSVGVSLRAVVWRELLTGALVGLTLGALAFPLVLAGLGEVDVALVLALAVLASCSTATLVAIALPWLLERRGWDPAFGSGPLATVVQDVASISIYLGIALIVLG